MWDLRNKFSHGRLSVRRISLLATTLVLAVFMATVGTISPALAADATRTGTTVSYSGKTFTELKASDILPSGLPPKTSGYESVDTTANKTYFILTTGTPASASSGQYVYYDGLPTSNFSNPSPPVTVSIADGPPTGAAATAGAPTTCDGTLTGGIGYILCPVVNFLASGMDHLYSILSSFLEVQPVKTGTDSSLYRMWAVVRDIANISFVIAFLVVVYSQVTSVGISNYNIKRMLPRLIIAAILVNISYWVSSIAVDISNLLGYSIHDLFLGVFKALNTTSQYKDVKWGDVSGFILSGGAIGALAAVGGYSLLATGLSGSLILLIPTLVGVLIAALVAILVMAARQALIVTLVIVSPLAFVAYLLPNTEKYFDKWKDLFMTMLLLFPIFSVLFGASQLAGLAIIQSAAGPNALNIIILGMTVMIAPVVITPMLIKFSGAFLGRMAGMVNNPKKGIMDRTRNWAQGRAQEEKAKILADKKRNSWVNRRTQAIDHRRRKREGWKKAHEMIADTKFTGSTDGQGLEAASRHNTNEKQRIDNAFGRTAVGQQLEFQSRMLSTDKQAVENEFNRSHFGHQADIAHRTVDLAKHQVESEHEANWNNAVRTDTALLRQSLDARSSEVNAELAKGKLEKLNAEIAAQGENTEHILNLKGVADIDQAGLLNIARDIKVSTNEATYTSMAKGMAERKAKELIAKDLSDVSAEIKSGVPASVTVEGIPIHQYAAGIKGRTGELAILAKAKTENSSSLVDDIKNIKSTMDYLESTSPDELLRMFEREGATVEERVAYATVMTERGGPGNTALRKAFDFMDQEYAGNPEDTAVQTFKELVGAMSGAMKSGKDIEFWLTNSRAKGTNQLRTLRDLSNDVGTWNSLAVEAFAGQNQMSQLKALRTLARTDSEKYNALVEDFRKSPESYAELKPAVKKAMAEPYNSDYWSDENLRTFTPEGETFDFGNPW